LTSGRVWGI